MMEKMLGRNIAARVLLTVAAAVVLLIMMPGTVRAEGETHLTKDNIGSYTTLSDGTYALDEDISFSSKLAISGNVVLETNGHNLTGPKATGSPEENDIHIGPGASLTVTGSGNLDCTISNQGTLQGGTISGNVVNVLNLMGSGTINGGTFTGEVKNYNVVNDGEFKGEFENYSVINGGTFEKDFTLGGVRIAGGTFNGNINTGTSSTKITGGVFNGTVTIGNDSAQISGGTFNASVTNSKTISGGTFNGGVTNNGMISDGTFAGDVENSGTISDGEFSGSVTNKGEISGGSFSGGVVNQADGIISGGTFSGSVANSNGQVAGGDFSDTTSLDGIYSVTFDAIDGSFNDGEHTVKRWCASGQKVVPPDNPEKEDYIFLHWYETDTETPFDFDTAITRNITLHAAYEPEQAGISYHQSDVDILKKLFSDNGLTGYSEDDLSGWDFVQWGGEMSDLRVAGLLLDHKNLTGQIDVSGLDKLEYLYANNNQLTGINVSGCTGLKILYVDDNQLTSLDASNLAGLEQLYCSNNQLAEISLNGCSSLQDLYCSYNNLTSLDVSGHNALQSLYCDNNSLSELKIQGCSSLEFMNCRMNELTELDLSGLNSLQDLYCDNNKITKLDLSGMSSLTSVYTCGNPLTEVRTSAGKVLKLSTSGNGTLSASIDNAEKQEISITAVPDSGYEFDRWSGSLNGTDNPCTINVTEDMNITANFRKEGSEDPVEPSEPSEPARPSRPASYDVSLDSSPEHGSVTISQHSAAAGTTVTITVKPDQGWTLETISAVDRYGNELDLTDKGNNQYTFRMPSGNVTVRATFMEDNSMLNFFTDVPVNAYYYDAVLWAAEYGITSGTSATTYSPDAPCTRGQMATFLWRLNGSPEVSGELPFGDVDDSAYYRDAVLWCYQQGITAGTSETTFSPEAPCTRGQMAAFLYRMRKSPAVSGKMPFTDIKDSAYYSDAVIWAKQNNITSGTSVGDNPTYSPEEPCTRGQMAVFLYHVKDVK